MSEFRLKVAEILVKWSMGTRQAAIIEIVREHERLVLIESLNERIRVIAIFHSTLKELYGKEFADTLMGQVNAILRAQDKQKKV